MDRRLLIYLKYAQFIEMEDNERLRRELLDLETKIKIQSKVKQQQISSR